MGIPVNSAVYVLIYLDNGKILIPIFITGIPLALIL